MIESKSFYELLIWFWGEKADYINIHKLKWRAFRRLRGRQLCRLPGSLCAKLSVILCGPNWNANKSSWIIQRFDNFAIEKVLCTQFQRKTSQKFDSLNSFPPKAIHLVHLASKGTFLVPRVKWRQTRPRSTLTNEGDERHPPANSVFVIIFSGWVEDERLWAKQAI